jgi:hypothetical protein
VGGCGDKYQPARPVRLFEPEGGGDRPAEGVANDDRVPDAEMVHQCCYGSGLAGRRVVVAGAAARPAMARPVEKQQFAAALQKRPERNHLIPEICAGAMDEDDRREIGVFRRGHMDKVQAGAVDLGEAADRRVAALDQPRSDARDADKHQEQREQEGDEGVDQIHAGNVRPEGSGNRNRKWN